MAQQTGQPPQQAVDTSEWAGKLAALIDQQVLRYQSLASVTEAQSKAVDTTDTDALLSALAKRQVIIGQITEANTAITPFVKSWQEHESSIPPALADAIRSSMGQLDQLVEAINAADERDRQALEAKRTAISSELSGVAQQRSAASAYAKQAAPSARFQDRRA